jgi:hypothetical protein
MNIVQSDNNSKDGVEFCNIWITGKTKLGQMLSQFYYSPFIHPYFGSFNSMEGFYHYIGTKEKDDKLRGLVGIKAKNYAKDLTRGTFKEFLTCIKAANYYKIEQNEEMKQLLIESTLPFEHYYLWGPGKIVIRPKQRNRVIEEFEELRILFKENQRPKDVDYSKYPELIIAI